MTEEAKATEEKPEAPAPEPEPEKPNGKDPDGTDFVDFSKLPPELREEFEPRFKRIYGHMKHFERRNELLVEHVGAIAKVAEETKAELAALKANEAASQIKAEIIRAKERGDSRAEVELTERLAKLRAPTPTPALPQLPQAETVDLVEARTWEAETGPDGNFLRPWAQPAHPEFGKVMNIARTLMGDPAFGGDLPRTLAEIDRRMGLKHPVQKRPATVMSAEARPPRGDLPELTDEMRAVARKMGIDPKSYAQQLKLLNRGAAR